MPSGRQIIQSIYWLSVDISELNYCFIQYNSLRSWTSKLRDRLLFEYRRGLGSWLFQWLSLNGILDDFLHPSFVIFIINRSKGCLQLYDAHFFPLGFRNKRLEVKSLAFIKLGKGSLILRERRCQCVHFKVWVHLWYRCSGHQNYLRVLLVCLCILEGPWVWLTSKVGTYLLIWLM